MRYYLSFLLLPLLAACGKTSSGPRLDLVGSNRYVSADRLVTTPGDTLTAKLYAESRDSLTKPLKRVTITVTYEPGKNPLTYPVGFQAKDAGNDPPFTYLDTVLAGTARAGKSFAFQYTFAARTTSGRERWDFEATDVDGATAHRAFRLTVRNRDSSRVYQAYTAQIQAPLTTRSRSYFSLLSGLVLPRYTVRSNPEAQNLINLIYLATKQGPVLASPTDTAFKALKWQPRATALRSTTLDLAGFTGIDTNQKLLAAFDAGKTPSSTRTTPLVKAQVWAFTTADQKTGLLYIEDVLTVPVPTLKVRVRISK